jgi:hypothetical protein
MWRRCHESEQPPPSLARFQAARSEVTSQEEAKRGPILIPQPNWSGSRQSAATRGAAAAPSALSLSGEAGFGDWIGKRGLDRQKREPAFSGDRRENYWRGEPRSDNRPTAMAVRPQFIAHRSNDPDARQTADVPRSTPRRPPKRRGRGRWADLSSESKRCSPEK